MTASAPARCYVMTPAGIRPGILVHRYPTSRCRVRIRDGKGPTTVHASLVFCVQADAMQRWRQARALQARMGKAGARVRVIDAHLSLALADGGDAV